MWGILPPQHTRWNCWPEPLRMENNIGIFPRLFLWVPGSHKGLGLCLCLLGKAPLDLSQAISGCLADFSWSYTHLPLPRALAFALLTTSSALTCPQTALPVENTTFQVLSEVLQIPQPSVPNVSGQERESIPVFACPSGSSHTYGEVETPEFLLPIVASCFACIRNRTPPQILFTLFLVFRRNCNSSHWHNFDSLVNTFISFMMQRENWWLPLCSELFPNPSYINLTPKSSRSNRFCWNPQG